MPTEIPPPPESAVVGPLDVVFLGSGAFGLPVLRHLLERPDRYRVPLVVSQPDRPAGRKRRLTPTPIAQLALEHDRPLLRPQRVNEPGVVASIREPGPAVLVVIAYGQKIGTDLLADRFAINLHGSLLPAWRGAAPIQRAVMAGDRAVGITVITLADRMDAGLMLGTAATEVGPAETAGELHDRLAALGPDLVESVLDGWRTRTLEPREQDETRATRAPKLTKEEGTIDLASVDAETARARINGLNPWPGCTVGVASDGAAEPVVRLRLGRVRLADAVTDGRPGTLVDTEAGLAACADETAVRILEAQPPGGRMMAWSDLVRGRPLPAGTAVRPWTFEHRETAP